MTPDGMARVGIPDLRAAGITELALIGSGGTATVFSARQIHFDRPVAVKVLHAPLADPDARRRFEREVALTGRLTGHPHVARVFEAGVLPDGRPYLVMEFYSGGSLADAIAASHSPQPRVLETGIQLAGALATAHSAQIVHRDVKPANVLFNRFGQPVLADFGIAAVTQGATTMTAAYTLQFAAPEALEDPPDFGPAGDQYSLALTMLAAYCGDKPWQSWVNRRLRPFPDEVGPLARAALEQALAPEPADRHRDMASFGAALQAAQRAEGGTVVELVLADLSAEVANTPAGWTSTSASALGGIGRPSTSDPVAPVARFCGSCGAPRSAQANFCGQCGTPVTRTVTR